MTAKCITCGGGSFAFTTSGVQCNSCDSLIPDADVAAYLALLKPQPQPQPDAQAEMIHDLAAEIAWRMENSISRDLDEFDFRNGLWEGL